MVRNMQINIPQFTMYSTSVQLGNKGDNNLGIYTVIINKQVPFLILYYMYVSVLTRPPLVQKNYTVNRLYNALIKELPLFLCFHNNPLNFFMLLY